MSRTVLFVHGMFQNAKSWQHWLPRFKDEGYTCIVKSWPLHEGEPSELRQRPSAELGDLRLQAVIDSFADCIYELEEPPIVIGHSVGGLVVQKLAEVGLVQSGIAICSVAPNRMLTFDWEFFRNGFSIANPLVGDSIFEMTPEAFHKKFANTMTREESDKAYQATVTHDSRNVLRDCMHETGQIELNQVRAPLLFIGAEKDQIIPAALCQKNAKAFQEAGVQSNYIKFSKRGHFICGEPGWEEVVSTSLQWLSSIKRRVAHSVAAPQSQNLTF